MSHRGEDISEFLRDSSGKGSESDISDDDDDDLVYRYEIYRCVFVVYVLL